MRPTSPGSSPASSTAGPHPRFSMHTKQSASRSRTKPRASSPTLGYQVMMQRNELSPDIERPDAVGEAARASVGQLAYGLDLEQQCCGGLNFGYFYDRSPIIAYDGEQAPTYTMGTFTSSTVPGCRAPHVW